MNTYICLEEQPHRAGLVTEPFIDMSEHLCKALENVLGQLWGRTADGGHVKPISLPPHRFILYPKDRSSVFVSFPNCAACEEFRQLLPGEPGDYDELHIGNERMDDLLDSAGSLHEDSFIPHDFPKILLDDPDLRDSLREDFPDDDSLRDALREHFPDAFRDDDYEAIHRAPKYCYYTSLSLRKYGDTEWTFCTQTIAPLGQQGCLSPKLLHPRTLDFASVKQWLSTCSTKHKHLCLAKSRPELQTITLIDTHTNTILPYACAEKLENQDVEYVCLSYVWGSGKQNVVRDGDRLLRVPRTIEDAMIFTRRIGKQYLWVDSVSSSMRSTGCGS
jgi:hypothetical protein